MVRKDSPLAPRASKKKKGSQQKVAGAGTKEFIPWVSPISRRSPDSEEEEEDDMSRLVHNFAARKQKRVDDLEQVENVTPEVVGGSGQPCRDGGSEVQAIIISGSLEMGLKDQPSRGNVTLAESKEASPIPVAL